MPIELVMPSNHLIFSHPLLILPSHSYHLYTTLSLPPEIMDPFHQELPIFIYLYLTKLLGIFDIKLGSNKAKLFIILFN